MMIMQKKYSTVKIKIDSQLKKDANNLFKELGLNMSTALNIFLRQSVREGQIPFELEPNSTTLLAMEEAESKAKNIHSKKFYSIEDLMDDLNN